MMNRFLLVFLMLWSSLAFATNTFFGNSGEGYLIADKVYLRDLVSGGAILVPFVGLETDLTIEDSISQNSVSKLELNRSLLARKIVDLNKMFPLLGQIILDVMNSYEWDFTDKELPLSPLDSPIDPEPLGSKRVSLANRYQNKIFIQRQLWLKMDPTQRAILVIHEAVYSLLKPWCTYKGCDQSPAQARGLVRRIFTHAGGGPDSFSRLLKASLDMPTSAPKICPGKISHSIAMSVFSNGGSATMMASSGLDREEKRDLFVRKACESLQGWDASAFPLKISTLIVRPPYGLTSYYYSQHGSAVQMNMSIFYRHVAESFSVAFESRSQAKDLCVGLIQRGMTGFFSLGVDDSGGLSMDDVCLIQRR